MVTRLACAFLGGALATAALGGCGSSTETSKATPSPGTGGARDGGVTPGAGGSGAGGRNAAGGAASGGNGSTGGSPADGGSSNGGSGGDGTDGGMPPLVELPPRPVWKPAFPLGTPGWRKSTQPFCSEIVGGLSPRVFSTKDAVYVAVSSKCNNFTRDTCNAPPGSSFGTERIYRNDGSGWARIFERFQPIIGGAPGAITGYSDGRIVLGSGDTCPVTLVDTQGADSCLWTDAPFAASAVTVAGDTDLFVLGAYESDPGTVVLWDYRGGKWTRLKDWTNAAPLPWPLVASSSRVLLAGSNQFVWAGDVASGQVAAVAGVPAGDYSAAWIFGASDVLLADAVGGLQHRDATKWTALDTGFADQFLGAWGTSDGKVFLYTQAAVGRWNAGTFTTLYDHGARDFPPHYFASIWGNTENEVFLALNDNDFKPYECGTTFMVWFDGTAFHQF